jgi:hypothetical protein
MAATKTEEQMLREILGVGEIVGTSLVIHTVFYTIIINYEKEYHLTLLGQKVIRQTTVDFEELQIFIQLHKRITNEQV